MKALMFFCLFLIFTHDSFAQSAATTEVVTLENWSSLLNLDKGQQVEVNTIEYQLATQLQELAVIKSSDQILYNNKLQAINANALAKLRNLLRPDQLNIYQQEIEKREKEKIAQAKQMRDSGATKSEIDNFLNNKK